MARRKQSQGDCGFCGRTMTKGGIGKHFTTCQQRQDAIKVADGKKRSGQTEHIYHLQISDAWSPDFWLHIEIKGSAHLSDLDHYLRAIWLECCGHLSQFSIGGWNGKEIPMDVPVERVFEPEVELTHIYDFGTSSETLIKMVDMRDGNPLTKRPIFLMARNQIPSADCAECREPAGWLCLECLIENEVWGTYCNKHAEEHPHDNYGELIPLVNSPRLGMCGYDGPAEAPY